MGLRVGCPTHCCTRPFPPAKQPRPKRRPPSSYGGMREARADVGRGVSLARRAWSARTATTRLAAAALESPELVLAPPRGRSASFLLPACVHLARCPSPASP